MKKIIFSEKLKYLRLKRNLSQSQLSKKIGITRQALSKYELGTSEPNLYTLVKIADYFECSIDSLVFDSIQLDNNIINLDLNYFLNELTSIQQTNNLVDNKVNNLKSLLNSIETTSPNKSHISLDEEYADELAPDIIELKDYKKEIVYREIPDYGYIPAGKISLTYEDDMEFVSIPEDNLCSYKDYYILHISGDSMNKLFDDGETILVEETSDVSPDDIVIARIDDKATVKKLANSGKCINLIPLSTNPAHKIQVIKSEDILFQGKVLGKLSDYL